jgi:ribonuclease HI
MNQITIKFDGGCRPTNPGNKYGSYSVSLDGAELIKVSRAEFGFGTNNEAEFDAFQSALRWTAEQLLAGGFLPSAYSVEAFSDSNVVVSRISKRNLKGKSDAQNRMAACAGRCITLLEQFRGWEIKWRGRDGNVKDFGH